MMNNKKTKEINNQRINDYREAYKKWEKSGVESDRVVFQECYTKLTKHDLQVCFGL